MNLKLTVASSFCLVLLASGCGRRSRTPEQTATDFIKCMSSGNAHCVFGLVSRRLGDRLHTVKGIDTIIADVAKERRLAFSSIYVDRVTTSGNYAEVNLKVVHEDAKNDANPIQVKVSLLLEDGVWKVDTYPGLE